MFTDTALAGFEREATQAGWTLEAALREAIERGWQGFKAEWVATSGKIKLRQPANERGGSLADIGDDVRRMFRAN